MPRDSDRHIEQTRRRAGLELVQGASAAPRQSPPRACCDSRSRASAGPGCGSTSSHYSGSPTTTAATAPPPDRIRRERGLRGRGPPSRGLPSEHPHLPAARTTTPPTLLPQRDHPDPHRRPETGHHDRCPPGLGPQGTRNQRQRLRRRRPPRNRHPAERRTPDPQRRPVRSLGLRGRRPGRLHPLRQHTHPRRPRPHPALPQPRHDRLTERRLLRAGPRHARVGRAGRRAQPTLPQHRRRPLAAHGRADRRRGAGAFAVVAEPDRLGATILARFGGLVDRFTFYAPFEHDAALFAPAAEALQRG
ncbi:hypothetical protein FB388_1932 [Pseudonocardia cypriaca]|uniref:Uncharacterized protein n=1 Tax=Pseudonocardia cypriaca TaxID=882449 RepID=A0A543GEQ0_9PSEU|nr:hypothetical protein FB388_1932 [Pseudonocardia cypriaca]